MRLKISYRMRASGAAISASRHWRSVSKRSTGAAEDPIVIEDEAPPTKIKRPNPVSNTLRLFNCPSCKEDENIDTVKLSSLIGTADLLKSFQFNFSIDVDFFKSILHPEFLRDKRQIVFITGSELLTPEQKINNNFSHILAPLPKRWGTHHSKMMINFYTDGTCEVVIASSNITKLDLGGLTQMLWTSGRMSKLGETSGTKPIRFQTDLLNYILKYKNSQLNALVKDLRSYNFSSCDVDLVASVPGNYTLSKLTDDSEIYGYGKLHQVLKRNNCLIKEASKKHSILAQVSSIASPTYVPKNEQRGNVFSHVLCPLFFEKNPLTGSKTVQPGFTSMNNHQKENNYAVKMVYPTMDEILDNNIGILAGQAVHFSPNKSKAFTTYMKEILRPQLHRWNSSSNVTGRERTTPHTKLYMCDNADNFKTLKWVYMGSHNLSKQAWGDGSIVNQAVDIVKYSVASYELGVVVSSKNKLVPVYSKNGDKNSVRLPFVVPPKPYGPSDEPWSTSSVLEQIKNVT